eukprot:TRINITY_DN1366_c1_g1_i12.p1 TRINITY_DN1366_c1_g1~~TRINITY_DN1366_c1_g1_i12.p1  ORF type:complete len:328 (+),score=95.77 TRINITY_DN1366_c1_g1_i12:69-986(+)
MPNHEVDTPAKDLPLPPLEAKINGTILPNLEKLEYKEFVDEGKTVLEKLATLRVQYLKQAHHDYLQATLKAAEEDAKNHLPTHECGTPVAELPLPPEEKKIKEGIIPKAVKLGYEEFVETASTFLAARLAERESALKNSHHDHLQATIKEAEAEAPKFMPTFDNDKPTDIPPAEKTLKDVILPKLKSLNFQDFILTVTSFLEVQQANREAESIRIIAEKAEKDRKKRDDDERVKFEEQRKKKEEEERIKLEEGRKQEAERLAKERSALADVERKKLEEEDKKRLDEENRSLAARLDKERAEEETK